MRRFFQAIIGFIKNHIIVSAIGGVAIVGVFVWLVFFYFAVHLLFVDDKVNETQFVFDSGAIATIATAAEPFTPAAPAATTAPPTTAAPPTEQLTPATTTPPPTTTTTTAPPPTTTARQLIPATTTTPPTTTTKRPIPTTTTTLPPPTTTTLPPPTTTTTTAAPALRNSAKANFVSNVHPTSGTAHITSDGTQTIVTFEDFKTDNGPDLDVYLTRSTSPGNDFINLGDLKGNIGNQFYEIRGNPDLSEFNTILIWCVRFSVLFGHVTLNQLP